MSSQHDKSAVPMPTAMHVLAVVAITPAALIALAAFLYGVYEWIYPPFTDAELMNFVDTWEPSAWSTMFGLALMGVVLAVSIPVAMTVKLQPARSIAISTVLLSALGALLMYRNHAALTQRVTQLTGHTFGGFDGLGIF